MGRVWRQTETPTPVLPAGAGAGWAAEQLGAGRGGGDASGGTQGRWAGPGSCPLLRRRACCVSSTAEFTVSCKGAGVTFLLEPDYSQFQKGLN